MAIKYPFEAKTAVFIVDSISDIAAPTVAEIGAGTDVSCDLTKDGLNPGGNTNGVDQAGLCSIVDGQGAGSVRYDMRLKFFRYSDSDTAWNLLAYGDNTHIVVRRGPAYDASVAGSQPVEVYKVQLGQKIPTPSAANTNQTFEVQCFVDDANLDAVVARVSFDVEDFLTEYERPSREVPIFTRDGLRARHAALEAKILAAAGDSLTDGPADMLDELRALEVEIEDTVRVFVLRAMSMGQWADLVKAHPPKSDEKDHGYIAHPDSFEPAALAASAAEPAMTVDQALRVRDTLPPGEWQALIEAIRDLHQEQSQAPKSLLLFADLLTSGVSPGTSEIMGSLAASSSAGSEGQ